MNTDITVLLDEFILTQTPYSNCGNSDYICSPTIRQFASDYLLGRDRLYQKQNGLYVLKSILVDDILLTDYSFEDIDVLEEQILILSAFDRVVTIQWKTLWEYFKLPSMQELNELSHQLSLRKIEEYNNPLKVVYYRVVDKNETSLSFEDWEIEMNTLHLKWLFCERNKLIDNGYKLDTIESYLSNQTFSEFLYRFENNSIDFLS